MRLVWACAQSSQTKSNTVCRALVRATDRPPARRVRVGLIYPQRRHHHYQTRILFVSALLCDRHVQFLPSLATLHNYWARLLVE